MKLFLFLVQVFVVSLSGALQPGPVTATAISLGARNRWAGTLLAFGHGIVEFPLMVLIVLGLGDFFQKTAVKIFIGAAGGVVLLFMAYNMFKTARHAVATAQAGPGARPILAGIVLTASNPYFLVWWTTVGLGFALTATNFGLHAFVLFAIVHWLVDFAWVTMLSFASFHGKTLLGPKSLEITLKLCAAVMLVFGLFFLYSSLTLLIKAFR
jgi:threonine/homoserine/homoserine lactone efflux protein